MTSCSFVEGSSCKDGIEYLRQGCSDLLMLDVYTIFIVIVLMFFFLSVTMVWYRLAQDYVRANEELSRKYHLRRRVVFVVILGGILAAMVGVQYTYEFSSTRNSFTCNEDWDATEPGE